MFSASHRQKEWEVEKVHPLLNLLVSEVIPVLGIHISLLSGITNPEIGTLFTFLTFRRKVFYFSCDIVSRKNISFLFFFKETLLIIGQGSQNVCLRKTVRRSENYFYTPGYRFVSVQMEKNNQQKQTEKRQYKQFQLIFT